MKNKKYLLKNRNVLISGAGIAGPSLAFWLNEYGFNVTVVEKNRGIRRGGYRVDLRGAAVRVADRMGIIDEIRNHKPCVQGSTLIDRTGDKLVVYDDPDLFGMRASGDVEIMRGDLGLILYDRTKEDVEYFFNDSIAEMLETSEGVEVFFNSGMHRTFDFVVGADGLHSAVREQVFGEEKNFVKNFGYYFAIFNVPNFLHLDHWEKSNFAKGSIFNVFSSTDPDSATALIMFDAPGTQFNSLDAATQKQFLIDHFPDAKGILKDLLAYVPDAGSFYFDSISQVYMKKLSKGRVVLLGDAGYCPSPASGQGTSLAIVGAYVLAGELAASVGDYQTGFRRYELLMKEFINLNRELGTNGLKQLFPSSGTQSWMRKVGLRLVFNLPFRKKIIQKIFGRIQKKVNAAANGIVLNDYLVSVVMGYDMPPARLV